MNAFARPEEAMPYEFPQFPKAEDEVTEYAYIEGAVDYQLRDFNSAESFDPTTQANPVVQPAVLQDFREVVPSTQA